MGKVMAWEVSDSFWNKASTLIPASERSKPVLCAQGWGGSGSNPSIWKRCADRTGIVDSPQPFAGEGHQPSRRDIMGDKGGKKDKEKDQKQKSEKQKENVKIKQEKQPKKKIG